MSSDLKISELNKPEQTGVAGLFKTGDKGRERDLLQEFSEILSKITSAVKTATQDADKTVAEVKQVEVKKTEKAEPDYRNFENTSDTKYQKDTFITKEEVEPVYKNNEAEVKIEENTENTPKENKEVNTSEEKATKENQETSKEPAVKETKEKEETEKVNIKVEKEVPNENTEQVIATNGEIKEAIKIEAKPEVKTEAKEAPKKGEKEVVKEEAFTYQENAKIEVSETKKEAINNVSTQEVKLKNPKEAQVLNENSEVKAQIKQEIINHLDKKEVKTDVTKQEASQSEEKIALKSEIALEKNIANAKLEVAQNSANQAQVNPKEKIMKNMIEQAKNILVKQFEYNISSNPNFGSANQGATNTIQNVQASLALKNNALASKGKNLPLPKTYATRTMHKVEEIIKELSKAKDGKTISVRLDPPSLGNLKVDVSLKEGALVARVTAESSQVGQFLKDKALELQQLLRKSGINVDEVNVWFGSQSEFSDTETRRDFEDFNQEFFENINDEFGEVDITSKNLANNKEVELDHWVA